MTHARAAFHQHLHGAVGQFQKLQHIGQHAVPVDAVMGGVVDSRIKLARQENLLVVLHHLLEGADGFLPANEKRHDHVGKNHDVAQRQNRIGDVALWHFAFLDVLAGNLGPPFIRQPHGPPLMVPDLGRLCAGFNRRRP